MQALLQAEQAKQAALLGTIENVNLNNCVLNPFGLRFQEYVERVLINMFVDPENSDLNVTQ